MTTAELAKITMLSPRTIRRYAQTGILNPRRRVLRGYDFFGDDLDKALIARDFKQRRLELVGPGLARHQRRRRNGGRTSSPRGRTGLDDVREARCPRCGTAFRHIQGS